MKYIGQIYFGVLRWFLLPTAKAVRLAGLRPHLPDGTKNILLPMSNSVKKTKEKIVPYILDLSIRCFTAL